MRHAPRPGERQLKLAMAASSSGAGGAVTFVDLPGAGTEIVESSPASKATPHGQSEALPHVDHRRFRLWVVSCSDLPRGRWRQNIRVRVSTATAARASEETPWVVKCDVTGGHHEPVGGEVVFRDRRYADFCAGTGLKLRFEVCSYGGSVLGESVLGYAEIDSEDLIRQRVWRLLLCQPGGFYAHEALYGNTTPVLQLTRVLSSEKLPPMVRRPAFLNIQVRRFRSSPSRESFCSPHTHSSTCSWPTLPEDASRPDDKRWPPGCGRPRPRVDKKRVMMMTRGTRGDVQPFVALARGLAQEPFNCEVRWKQFIKDNRVGLPKGSLRFRPSGGDTVQKMSGPAEQWALRNVRKYDALHALILSRSEVEYFPCEGTFFWWAYEEQPDFIVFGFILSHIAMIISEALRIPIVGFLLQPDKKLETRMNLGTLQDQLMQPVREAVASEGLIAVLQQLMERTNGSFNLNLLRKTRGLSPVHSDFHDSNMRFVTLAEQCVPVIVPINRGFLGLNVSPEWTYTDFIFLRVGSPTLHDNVRNFIDQARKRGRKVIAMTFSSMPVGQEPMLTLAIEVCTRCVPPAADDRDRQTPAVIVLLAGQERCRPSQQVLDEVERLVQEGRMLVLNSGLPFETLFPKVDAVILHGGLGVTSEAVIAGIPVVTSGILLLDQRFWAKRLADLGMGSEGLSVGKLLEPQGEGAEESRIVGLMHKALDSRPSKPGEERTWTERARDVQKLIIGNRSREDLDGVAINARTVFEAGMYRSAVVRDAYCQGRGFAKALLRQMNCCGRCWAGFARWLCMLFLPALFMSLFRCVVMLLSCCRSSTKDRPSDLHEDSLPSDRDCDWESVSSDDDGGNEDDGNDYRLFQRVFSSAKLFRQARDPIYSPCAVQRRSDP